MSDLRHYKHNTPKPAVDYDGRRKFLFGVLATCMVVLVGRAVDLQVLNKKYLQEQGELRHVDDMVVNAYRGIITDRNGNPLAISSPVESVAVWPKQLNAVDNNQIKVLERKLRKELGLKSLTQEQKDQVLAFYNQDKANKIRQMVSLLHVPLSKANELLNKKGAFSYVAQRISPQVTAKIKALELPGVAIEPSFKRFYPTGEVSAHLVGYTDINDIGKSGLEKTYESHLQGIQGSKRVIKDGHRRVIADIENIKEPQHGKYIELSIDQRIQYLAYRELQIAIASHKAKAGSLVVMDANNGEVLAAVNLPSFNPNTKADLNQSSFRCRVINDIFEPGSTVKPFVVAGAIDGHYINPNDSFETHGFYTVGKHTITDTHNHGTLDIEGILQKSSNIGMAKIAFKMPRDYIYSIYHHLGFGSATGSLFPGEPHGRLPHYKTWHESEHATVSYGYGLSVSVLQLAKAYTALADNGILHSVSLLKRDEDPDARRIFTSKTAKKVRKMLESVIAKEGTAFSAHVDGYRVAGKTGTVRKARADSRGYADKSYFSVFAGMAPASKPRLVIVVMIDEPSAGDYYGGLVSAPVFSKVMEGALRIMEIPPDQENTMPILLTKQGVIRTHDAEKLTP